MNAPLWFSNLLFWSAQVALIVLAAWLLVRLLRIHDPRVLLVHWRALIVASFLLLVIEPWRRLSAIPAIPFAPLNSVIRPGPAPAPIPPHRFFSFPLFAYVVAAVIFLGVAFRFAMFALGVLKLRQLRRASSPILRQTEFSAIHAQMCATTGAHGEVRISAQLHSPVTFGFARPVILLPERLFRLGAQSQAAILCHELLHVRRRDWTHHLVEEILRVLFWFHPAILWLIARIRLSREQLVDLEVVRLTGARKIYLDALLEFAARPGRIISIPAPPFLAERQIIERISLMLKEVRMSRTRLIASLSVVAFCLAACAVLVASVFPLKAAPRLQAPPQSQTAPAAASPVVNADAIWTARVKRGDMPIQVRGLAKPLPSANEVRVSLPEAMMADVHAGQSALVDTHKAILRGNVSGVSPQVIAGVRTADITLDSPLPNGSDPGATFEATIVVGKLDNVVYVGRPAMFSANSAGPVLARIFKVVESSNTAQRVTVQFGRASATTIQVLSGLQPGDTVILSDMSPYEKFSRIQIKR